MTDFMLDADAAIFAIRGNDKINDAIGRAGHNRVAMSSLVYSQLLQGIVRRPQPTLELALIEAFVATVEIKPYGVDPARAYGRLVAAIGFSRRDAVDRMIAAHAISLDATLVTNNIKDFADIPDLAVTNWAAP